MIADGLHIDPSLEAPNVTHNRASERKYLLYRIICEKQRHSTVFLTDSKAHMTYSYLSADCCQSVKILNVLNCFKISCASEHEE